MQTSRPQYNTRLREMPSSDRPRERLRDLGAGALSTAELLAIVLRTGTADQNVLSLAQSLLGRHHGLSRLARLSYSELVHEKGLGAAKAAELLATFQIARRLKDELPEEKPIIGSPADVNALLGWEMAQLEQEQVRVLLLNTRNQLVGRDDVYKGSVNTALVRPAELLREAVRHNAPAIILVHNHPSGDPQPSPDDVSLTRQLFDAGALLCIELLDHVVIGDGRVVSLRALNLGFPAQPAAPVAMQAQTKPA